MSEENNNEMINTQEQQPVEQSVSYEAAPYADYSNSDPGTPVKKKHKGLKIALIVIAAVIVPHLLGANVRAWQRRIHQHERGAHGQAPRIGHVL